MREVQKQQMDLGAVGIADIELDLKSRDDIPAILLGLQHLYSNQETRTVLFSLLEEHIGPGTDRHVGRPGMALWRILVMGVLKQGLGCDFDRVQELANQHRTVREFLGHGAFAQDEIYQLQTIMDNVRLLTPALLSAVGGLVVASGHQVAGKKPGEPLRGRCDSFVVETNVHYPTDVGLLWDAMRCLLRETGPAAQEHGVVGWRQWRHLSREVRTLFNRVRSTRRAKSQPDRVAAYVKQCRVLVERAEETLKVLQEMAVAEAQCLVLQGLIAHARRQMDQVERRLLKDETIPHQEKVFSIFEEHTRWVSKGKAGKPVEFGVPVCVIEDQYQFILHHKVLWQRGDVAVAVPMIQETQALHPDFRVCSFDRGFHSPENRVQLDDLLDLNALPRKGRHNRADREREAEEAFAGARQQHPAVESAINNLEHRGLDRVRSHGAEGFAQTVALSVLAANLHRIGLLLRRRVKRRRAA